MNSPPDLASCSFLMSHGISNQGGRLSSFSRLLHVLFAESGPLLTQPAEGMKKSLRDPYVLLLQDAKHGS